MNPRPIGRYLSSNARGELQRDCTKSVNPKWKREVDAILKLVTGRLGAKTASIYLRGSVARGLARIGFSDIDIIVLTHRITAAGRTLILRSLNQILDGHPEIKHRVDLQIEDYQMLLTHPDLKHLRFLLKTSGLRIFGTGALGKIKPFKVSRNICFYLEQFRADVAYYFSNIKLYPRQHRTLLQWILRRALRSAGEFAMLSTKRYSRDLWYCHKNCMEILPMRKSMLDRILRAALGERIQFQVVHDDLRNLVRFLK
jgi:hypothetical protein